MPSRTPVHGNEHGAKIEELAEGGDDDGGDAHDFGAIAAHAESFHAVRNVEAHDAPES